MDNYVKSIKDGLAESIDFFRNYRKGERERWVASEFLRYLVEDLDERDVIESTQEPIDVIYNDIEFQIKEIQSEGSTRGKEYNDKFRSITEETEPHDLLEEYCPIHIPINNAMPMLVTELQRHRTTKYHKLTNEMNVLVYLNLNDTTYSDVEIDYTLLDEEIVHWLSVSVVTNNCAIVLSCNDPALERLSLNVGKLYFKNEPGKYTRQQ